MDKIRKDGKKALTTLFTKPKNVEILERNIFTTLTNTGDERIEEYNKKLYEVLEFYKISKNVKETFQYIKENKFDHKHEVFDEIKKKQKEHDDFILNPFEVSEGVLECNKCGSKQTISTSKQTRAGDESTTVFAMCVKCNATWKI